MVARFFLWRMTIIFLMVMLICLCACGTSSPLPDTTGTPSAPISTVSLSPTPIIPSGARMLAQAEQAESPAIAWLKNGLLVTWIGTDDLDIRHFAQWQFNGQWQPAQALSLLTNRPYRQQLVVTTDDIAYLFWLDTLPEFTNPQQLWYAPISENYGITPGAIPLSKTETAEFTALANANGGIWTIWRGGLLAEPTLYAQYIDSLGRQRLATAILENATHPVLVADETDGQWLFWLHEGYIWGGKWENGVVADARELALSVVLAQGDLLEHFTVGIAGDDAFAFWHVSNRDGRYQSYWLMGELNAPNWGTNTPYLHDATWLTPNRLASDTLYAVGVTNSTPYDLRIYQWNGESWWAKREGVMIPSGLLRPPVWMRRSEDEAVLAWSQPNGLSADLWLWGAD
ncbi:MAG: hypothetical protein SFZ02_07500 [bacterium]|nr:hypothetical protein [bacterium]